MLDAATCRHIEHCAIDTSERDKVNNKANKKINFFMILELKLRSYEARIKRRKEILKFMLRDISLGNKAISSDTQ